MEAWNKYLADGCPCEICKTPTNPKWDGKLSNECCLGFGQYQCNKFFCPEHRHPDKHNCSRYFDYKNRIEAGYRRYCIWSKYSGCRGYSWEKLGTVSNEWINAFAVDINGRQLFYENEQLRYELEELRLVP